MEYSIKDIFKPWCLFGLATVNVSCVRPCQLCCSTVKQKKCYSRSEGAFKIKLPGNLYFRVVHVKCLALSHRSSVSSRELINALAQRTLLINTSSEPDSSSSVYESYGGVRARVHGRGKGKKEKKNREWKTLTSYPLWKNHIHTYLHTYIHTYHMWLFDSASNI